MRWIISLLFTSIALFAREPMPHNSESSFIKAQWHYENNATTKEWGKHDAICDLGKAQSPINIISNKTVELSKSFELEFHQKNVYRADIIDNGHSIKVTPRRKMYINVDKKRYLLLQFHYHGKSEHSIDGRFYDLVVHAVCQNQKTKELLVVGVFYTQGKKNVLLEKVLNNINHTITITKSMLPHKLEAYYHYIGSLTTPPCSENVNWYILKAPLEASPQQITQMQKYYVNNYRPIQELNNRIIEMH